MPRTDLAQAEGGADRLGVGNQMSVAADVTDQKATSPYDLVEFIDAAQTNNARYSREVAQPRWGIPYDGRFVPDREDINFAGFNDNSGIDE